MSCQTSNDVTAEAAYRIFVKLMPSLARRSDLDTFYVGGRQAPNGARPRDNVSKSSAVQSVKIVYPVQPVHTVRTVVCLLQRFSHQIFGVV